MGVLAIIIPEKIPVTVSKGVHRAFLGLQKLSDDYIVYYEPLIDAKRPDFLIISPDLGMLVIEIRNWYSGMISGVTDQEVRILGNTPRIEVNPLFHARQYLSVITRRIHDNPVFFPLLTNPGESGGHPCFSIRTVLLLPNCTIPQLAHHQLGNLHKFFDPNQTICREMLLELEKWEPEELIPFLKSLVPSEGSGSPLTTDQIHLLRAVIHPDIVIDLPSMKGTSRKSESGSSTLKMLDFQQEKNVYQIRQGHQVIDGAAGSGKTTILAARARILHHHPESRILILCCNIVLCEKLRLMLTGYPRISVFSFDEWAEKQEIFRKKHDSGVETDQEFGTRLFQKLLVHGGDYRAYDAVLIDEAQDFSPSWIQAAHAALKDPEHGDLLIVSDGYQGQYGPGGIRWKELGIHSRGRIMHQVPDLGTNYRNTREISNLAQLFLLSNSGEKVGDLNVHSTGQAPPRSGLKPLLVWNTTHANQGKYATFLVCRLLGSLKSVQYLSGLTPDDICILYPHAEDQDYKILSGMISELSRFCPVQWISENNYTPSKIHLPGVKVHDGRSIKGIQYRVVMVLFSEYYDTYLHDTEYASDRHLFYVALTRPMDFLTIQYTKKTALIRHILDSGDFDEFIGT